MSIPFEEITRLIEAEAVKAAQQSEAEKLSSIELERLYKGKFKIRKVTLVVVGNYRQYVTYLREARMTREDALYVHRPDQILGLHKGHVERIVYRGEFWLNPLYGSDELRMLAEELRGSGK